MSGATERAQRPPKHHRMIYPWMTVSGCVVLEAEAAFRHVHRDRLAAAVLEIVTRDNLFAALLDR